MASPRSFWRRSHDRSLHLIVAALILWLITFCGYRIATAVAVTDPIAELIQRANAVLAIMPTNHPLRQDLVDVVQQAQAPLATTPATPNVVKPGAIAVTREVQLATKTLQVLERLQTRTDRARERLHEATASVPPTVIPSTTESNPDAATTVETPPGEPVLTPAEAEQALSEAAALLPPARPLRTLSLWLADIPKYERERNFWAAFWAITAATFPAAISFWYLIRGRQLPISFPPDNRLPAAVVRQREQDRDLRQSTLSAYFLHALMIILPMIGFSHAYNLGPPGGGGGIVGAQAQEKEQIKVVKVKQRKLMVNPFSAIRINQPKELDLDLAEDTRQMATATVAGGSGEGEGGGYGAGVKGGLIRFVVLHHGGGGWDEANAVAAPNFLREFGRRVSVPTDRKPISVRVSDLAAQSDPLQQPPLVYLCGDASGFDLPREDIAYLRRYLTDIGGMLLIDDTGGALRHAQTLAAQLFPGQPLLAIPNDDQLFHCRSPMAADDRALARHGGDRILGVRDKGRWVIVFHPGDLIDGWRGAYGVRWQEIAYRFGINCWDYAATQFDHVRTAREKR